MREDIGISAVVTPCSNALSEERYSRSRPAQFVPRDLLVWLRQNFLLDWQGIHGAPHWARVAWNGFYLARHVPGVRLDVVALFAFLHDHRRQKEDEDPGHGVRAATSALELRGRLFVLDDEGMDLLAYAMIRHSEGDLDAPVTVQVCWDADRLDIGRVGAELDPTKLCTAFARREDTVLCCDTRARRHNLALTLI